MAITEKIDSEQEEGVVQPALSNLAPTPGSRRKRKRVGMGPGSGLGKTCGRGHKGQGSRSGAKLPPGFEGGQMPIHRRLPKVGFVSRRRVRGENVYNVVSLQRLSELDVEGELTLDVLREHGVVRSKRKCKILGPGPINKRIVVEAHSASKSAREAIEQAGGELRIISSK